MASPLYNRILWAITAVFAVFAFLKATPFAASLMVFIPAILVTFDARELWDRVAWVDGTMSRHPPDGVPVAEARR